MSGIFDSLGIDPGIIIIILLVLSIVLIINVVSSNMRLSRLERKYKLFMKGTDGQSLEKMFIRKFAQIDRLYEAKEDHERDINYLKKAFGYIFSYITSRRSFLERFPKAAPCVFLIGL